MKHLSVILVLIVILFCSCQNKKPEIQQSVSNITLNQTKERELISDNDFDSIIDGKFALPEIDSTLSIPAPILVYKDKNELFLMDSTSNKISQLTTTGGKVDTYFVSPSRNIVAFQKVIMVVSAPGLYESEEIRPKQEIYSIVVLDVSSQNIIKEIQPFGFNLEFVKWISKNRFLLYDLGEYEVSDYIVYDILRDSIQHKTGYVEE